MEDYNSIYSGQEIDEAVGKALNPDSAPTAGSQALVTSGGVKSALNQKANSADLGTLEQTVQTQGGKISTIEGKIPTAASPSNQLADKGFVTNGLGTKQDTIQDLEQIRARANEGHTAYQKPSGGIPKTDLDSGVQTSLGKADTAVQPARVEAIEEKIPAQASSENKLADKNFVNSTVATATATFRGTYNLVSDLGLTVTATQQQIAAAIVTKLAALGITADNNDYVFVQIPTANDKPTEIARVDRYKYNGSAWGYEWSLNNSSFTAAQWASINSGITSEMVTKLGALPTASELATAFAGKVDKVEGKGLSTNDYSNDEKAKLGALPTNATLEEVLAGKAAKSNVDFIETSFGKYDAIRDITLTQNKSGKYVDVNGQEVSASGYGISNSVELNFGDILLVPSASAVPAAVSVVSRIVTRTYQKVINYTYTYQQENPSLYDTATADYDSSLIYTAVYDTSGETPVLTGWTKGGQTYTTLPATREVTESYYEPLVKQAVSAMPSTGYYIYLCPSAMTVVVSGYTATVSGGVCKVVGWGIFKNIVSNFVGAPGQAILAQLLCDLDDRVKGIMSRLENLGDVKAITVDSENLPKVCGQPLVIEGAGAPAVVPHFVGQRYHDTTNKKCYEAFLVTGATSDWTLLN